MPIQDTATESIEVLLRRIEIAEQVSERPMDKRELVAELGVSRSTIDRATRELQTVGLLAYSDGTFELTSSGRMAMAGFFDLVDDIELRQRLEPFFRWIPDPEFDLDPRLLADAEVVLAEPGDPYAMINKHVSTINNMESCRGLLPFTGLHAQEAAHEQIVRHGARAELVMKPEIADVQRFDSSYAELTSEMQATGRFELFVADGTIPYALCMFDDTVQIVVAEGDQPRALLETENERVLEWAEGVYQGYKADAEQVIS